MAGSRRFIVWAGWASVVCGAVAPVQAQTPADPVRGQTPAAPVGYPLYDLSASSEGPGAAVNSERLASPRFPDAANLLRPAGPTQGGVSVVPPTSGISSVAAVRFRDPAQVPSDGNALVTPVQLPGSAMDPASPVASTGAGEVKADDAAEEAADDEEPKPWKLFPGERIDLGGWSQTGYHTRSDGMFNNLPDRFQQHQMWFYAEKKADGSEGPAAGFRMDYVWGTDGPDTQAFGNPPGRWDIDWDNGGFYGHAIPQLYGELAAGDVSVKVGHFFTPVGYEVVQAPGNFFYSHAYTMYNAEPFTHTGALATLNMGDLTAYGGWTNGWDTGFADNGGSTFLGGGSLNLNEQVNLTYITTIGRIGNGTDQQGYSHSIVLQRELTERLRWITQSDLVDFEGTVSADRKAFGINNYLIADLNERWAAGTRFEWWRPEVAPGDDADLYGLTFGLNWKPNLNVVVRPEVRWNRDDDGLLIPGADNNRFGFGCDMIVTF